MRLKARHIILSVIVWATSSFIQLPKTDAEEYSVKAAFIYNFTKFIEWEESAEPAPFVIGIIGDSPIYKPLQELAVKKTVNNKKIEIRHCVSKNASLCKCQILFVPETIKNKEFQAFLAELNVTKNILIISESKGFLDNGSAINFLMHEDHIKFEINVGSLNKCNLKASAQLLKLASNIQH